MAVAKKKKELAIEPVRKVPFLQDLHVTEGWFPLLQSFRTLVLLNLNYPRTALAEGKSIGHRPALPFLPVNWSQSNTIRGHVATTIYSLL
jgi:hypothetical protein